MIMICTLVWVQINPAPHLRCTSSYRVKITRRNICMALNYAFITICIQLNTLNALFWQKSLKFCDCSRKKNIISDPICFQQASLNLGYPPPHLHKHKTILSTQPPKKLLLFLTQSQQCGRICTLQAKTLSLLPVYHTAIHIFTCSCLYSLKGVWILLVPDHSDNTWHWSSKIKLAACFIPPGWIIIDLVLSIRSTGKE